MKLICQFCKKEFKTETGFQKHICTKKERYENFNILAFKLWLQWHKFSKLKVGKNEEKNKLRFIGSKEYLHFVKFTNYLIELNPINAYEYVKWLVQHNVKINNWTNTIYYHQWIIEYLKNENEIAACKRSEMFLAQENVDINQISENRLYLYLYYGKISPYYIKKIGKKILLILGDDLLLKLKDIIDIII